MRPLISRSPASLVLVLTLLCSGTAAAESWYTGVKAGVNVADEYGDDANSAGTRTLFAGGALVGTRFDAHLGARLEILYVQKGSLSDLESTFPGQDPEHKTRIDYIELPLLFVVSLPVGESFVVDFFAGPAFDIQVHAEFQSFGVTEDLGPVTPNFDFCGTLGAGLRYGLSKFSLVADGRYTLGTLSTVDVDGFSPDVKNRGLTILAGIEFPIGSH